MLIQKLARSLTLAAVGMALIAFPATAAIDGAGCPSGSVPWVYASGSTGIGWMSTPGNGINTGTHVANGKCDQAWAAVGVNPTYGMSMNVYYGSPGTWNYTCTACIHSIVQNLNHAFENVFVPTGSAGDIGGQVGGGVVIGIQLQAADGDKNPQYHVDVARGNTIVQVMVDAKTGAAQLVGEEAPSER